MDTQIFKYNDCEISFNLNNEGVMINATQMAKPFGGSKRPQFWLSLQSTNEFIQALAEARNLASGDLVGVVKGGNDKDAQGTWMHEDVAIEYARWLNPKMAIWCNDRIKELFRHGFTATDNKLEEMINNPDLVIGLASKLKEERAKSAMLEEKTAIQDQQIKVAAPKVEYHDTVLMSADTYTTNQIAKELGISAVTLNKKLKAHGIQYSQSGQWLLYAKYQNKGYTKTHTYTFTHVTTGQPGTTMRTVWTEEGRKFIHGMLKKTETVAG